MTDEVQTFSMSGGGQQKAPVTFSLSGSTPPQPLTFSLSGKTPEESVEDVIKRYGRPLTQSDFLSDDGGAWKDPALGRLIEENLDTRYKSGSFLATIAKDTVVGASGGVVATGWQDMSPKDKFETWQNYHRSFAGGHTVTTANEVAYSAMADDDTKAKLGKGYILFENMDNIFTGEGTWGDTFDGVKDYMSAAIWDPTTALSLGVGRAWTMGGAKGSAKALSVAAKTAYKTQLQKSIAAGATKSAAKAAATRAQHGVFSAGLTKLATTGIPKVAPGVAKRVLAYGAPDLVIGTGTDIAYQSVLLDTGAQDKYSYAQTGIAALGAIAIPALVESGKLSAKGLSRLTEGTELAKVFGAYKEIKMTAVGQNAATITQQIKDRIDLTKVDADLRVGLQGFKDSIPKYLAWAKDDIVDAKDFAALVLKQDGIELSVDQKKLGFYRSFLFGAKDGSTKGFVESLKDAGFVYYPRGADDKVTNWLGDAISWIPDKTMKDFVEGYEAAVGSKLGIGYTPKDIAANFKLSQSLSGQELWNSRYAAGLLKKRPNGNTTVGEMLEGMFVRGADEEDAGGPQRLHYLQSIWKRMVTAHPGTTGLNVKGWSQMSVMNSVSDLVLGGLNYGQAAFKLAKGDTLGAKYLAQHGKGSILGSIRRGYNLLDFNDTIDTAWNYLNIQPEVADKLFRDIAGDGGVGEAIERFGLDPNSKLNQLTEGAIHKVQQITGVRLQDEMTKLFSFQSNLDQAIMREYGQGFNEFMARPDFLIEMASERYATQVTAPALDRTLRETASKSWSEKKGSSWMLGFAKKIEQASNDSMFGYAIPFGRFFNTSMAVMGDYSMINFARHGLKKINGKTVDMAEDEGAELFAKGLVGWSALAIMGKGAEEKISEGLAWNQEREADGSIKDVTYDFPESAFRAMAQAVGHKMKDGEVPVELKEEIAMVLGGQTFRSSEESIKAFWNLAESIVGLDEAGVAEQATEIFKNFTSNLVSGFTRPLDPINQAAMLFSEDYTQMDRRQGYKFINEATRYVDKLDSLVGLPDTDEPQRYSPTKGSTQTQDFGKVLGGVRSTAEPTPIDRMLSSVGLRDWQAIKWDGSPEVKNRMDQLIAPILNAEAAFQLRKHPDFYDLPLEERRFLVDGIIDGAKKKTRALLDKGVGEDASLKIIREIEGKSKAQVKKVMDKLGYEGDLTDIAAQPGGSKTLETILYMIDNYDSVFFKDLE